MLLEYNRLILQTITWTEILNCQVTLQFQCLINYCSHSMIKKKKKKHDACYACRRVGLCFTVLCSVFKHYVVLLNCTCVINLCDDVNEWMGNYGYIKVFKSGLMMEEYLPSRPPLWVLPLRYYLVQLHS